MKKLTQEEIKELFEQEGYYISNYLLSKTCLGLYYLSIGKSVGQEVFSMCLDGPSGAGKTYFVDTYCKVASKILEQPIKFINFQLDAETGKSDLYEDIDVVATFEGDTSKIRIPGKIIEAFQAVNDGNYVILKMDEYDKARDSTDTFFNNCLQEGLINTIQHGNIEIKKENRGKLQVFLCKNDIRAELSEPMMRRNRIVRLEYMDPERLFLILNDFAKKEDCPTELVNLVTLIYEQIYKNCAQYAKLPSCSECQQAIMDASILMKFKNFSKSDIYTNIIEDMLKMRDDIQSFESIISSGKQSDLSKLIKEMKNDTYVEATIDINDLIMRNVYANQMEKLEKETKKQIADLAEKKEKMEQLLLKYELQFMELEQKRQGEIKRIQLANGELVSEVEAPNVLSNFEDETQFVKRGQDIFKTSISDWTDIAMVQLSNVSHYAMISKLVEYAKAAEVIVYENGVLIQETGNQKLIVVSDLDEEGKLRYRLLSNYPVIPATYLQDIKSFITFLLNVQTWQRNQEQQVVDQVVKTKDSLIQKYGLDSNPSMAYSINCLAYSDTRLELKEEEKNVYHVDTIGNMDTLDHLQDLISSVSCQEPNQAIIISNEMLNKRKVKSYE